MTEDIFNYELSEETAEFNPLTDIPGFAQPYEQPAPPFNLRQAVLGQAMDIVMNDRQASYGTPESNFGIISDLWTTYLGTVVRPDDVAAMMILLKLARHRNARSLDNAVDVAGYAACMAEVDFRD